MSLKHISSGFVVYRKNKVIEYLLILNVKGHWDFPKGHVEEGESILEGGYRELEEETGIKREEIKIENCREEIEYDYYENNVLNHKKVYFFLARYVGEGNISLSQEHKGYAWLSFDEALNYIKYKEQKDVLKKCNSFLNN